ncbi:MAG: 2-dehydro-3-deoxy-D-gluconate 5-dehydrogenase KduD [Chloroflexota bacterium]|nr:2-dehydro-3-deoxy-D-gluconate 5-dehydrogenase KduD [Chloroflexota bacterium]
MILDMFKLDDKVALVTGASRGLGQGMAIGLAEAGADVVGVSRSSCSETAEEIEALGRRFLHMPFDLYQASAEDLQGLIEDSVEAMGDLDILVNVAGTIAREPTLVCSEAAWNKVLKVNLTSLMFLSQAAARYFVERGGGKIINVASMLSFEGGFGVPSYTASKHGVAGVTRAMANELASQNVNVNAIAPGYMLTELTAVLEKDPERNPAILARIPADRWGTPEDLKGMVVFLASEASNYCHGGIYPVDGGWLSR